MHPLALLCTRGGSTPGGEARAAKIVARPQKFSRTLDTLCGQLILRKISKFDASRCQILRLKCTKFDFRLGSAPDHAAWGSLQRSPRPLSCI